MYFILLVSKGPTTTSSAILLVPFTKCVTIIFYYHYSCYFMLCINFVFVFVFVNLNLNLVINSFIHLHIHIDYSRNVLLSETYENSKFHIFLIFYLIYIKLSLFYSKCFTLSIEFKPRPDFPFNTSTRQFITLMNKTYPYYKKNNPN